MLVGATIYSSTGDVVEGRGGNDLLFGDGKVDGGPGNDSLVGGGHLQGGPGDDSVSSPDGGTIDGGPGRDLLSAAYARAVVCGGGADVLALRNQYGDASVGSPIGPLVRDPCARLDVIGFFLDGLRSTVGRVDAVARREVSFVCGAAVEVRAVQGRQVRGLLGRARWRWSRGGRQPLSLALSRAGRRAANLHRAAVIRTTSFQHCPRMQPMSRAYRTASLRIRL